MKQTDNKDSNTSTYVVTRETNIAELIGKFPEAAEIFLDFGLHCVGCFASSFDNIGQGSKVHGMSDEDIDEMIERLNEVVSYGE